MAETVIASCCYFPPILFFKEFASAKNIIVDVHEYFVKQTLRNRTYICSASGRLPLVIPVKHTGGKLTPVKDIQISYDSPWQKNHWRSIASAYRNAPWFEFMEDDIAPFFYKKEKFLCDFNEEILNTMLLLCSLDVPVTRSEKYVKDYSASFGDVRNLSEIQNFKSVSQQKSPGRYPQVFGSRLGFITGVSILDVLFNLGKGTSEYLTA